jgi:activator of HSP90 ATPase
MVLHNPNNWHWVNKDVSAWAKNWFDENLTKLVVENGDVQARISKVQSMDGDVDVSQRKGKVITIFDVKLVLEYTGTRNRFRLSSVTRRLMPLAGSTAEDAEVSGTITVPEVAHDTEEDDYVVSKTVNCVLCRIVRSSDKVLIVLVPKVRRRRLCRIRHKTARQGHYSLQARPPIAQGVPEARPGAHCRARQGHPARRRCRPLESLHTRSCPPATGSCF